MKIGPLVFLWFDVFYSKSSSQFIKLSFKPKDEQFTCAPDNLCNLWLQVNWTQNVFIKLQLWMTTYIIMFSHSWLTWPWSAIVLKMSLPKLAQDLHPYSRKMVLEMSPRWGPKPTISNIFPLRLNWCSQKCHLPHNKRPCIRLRFRIHSYCPQIKSSLTSKSEAFFILFNQICLLRQCRYCIVSGLVVIVVM